VLPDKALGPDARQLIDVLLSSPRPARTSHGRALDTMPTGLGSRWPSRLEVAMRKPVILAVFLAAVFPSPGFSQVPIADEFQVNTYTTSNQHSPRVASDADGNFVIVWQSEFQDGSFGGVFAQRYDTSGAPVGAEFQVNSTVANVQNYPDVSAGPGGRFVAVWSGYGPSGLQHDVFARRYDAVGTPAGPEFRVNAFSTNLQRNPAIATASNGNFVVAWDADVQDGSNRGIFVQRFDINGNPQAAEFRANSFTTGDQYRPAIASDAAGNFLVVWEGRGMGGLLEVSGQFFNAFGVRLGSEFRVNTYTTYGQRSASVAADPAGNFVVVWESLYQDAGDFSWGVFGQRFLPSGARLGSEFQVNTYSLEDQRLPAVAADASGAFTVVWMTDTVFQGRFEIAGRRYSSTGVAGPEFPVNAFTTDVQGLPALAMQPNGNFVVSWGSYTQDGYRYGVFARRFSVDLIFADGFE
jgi:hypothetical protein